MTKIKVFVTVGDMKSDGIIAKLHGLPNLEAKVYTCPKAIESVQPMPFLEVEGGERFLGEEGINVFVQEQKEFSSVLNV